MAQTVKNLPAMWETWVRSLGQEGPLEKGVATHSSILAWRIPMDRGAWQATVHGVTKSDLAQHTTICQLLTCELASFPEPCEMGLLTTFYR